VRLRAIYERGRDEGEFVVDDVDLQATVGFATLYGAVELYPNKRLPPQYWDDPAPVFSRAPAGVLAGIVPDGG
jgi:hypothetical protein